MWRMKINDLLLWPLRAIMNTLLWLWMAATHSGTAIQPNAFTSSDRMGFRLNKICTEVCRKHIQQVFLWGSKKDEKTSLEEFLLKDKGWTERDFNKRFNKDEQEKLKSDTKGETYDVTLLYKIIPWACEGLAPAGNPRWVTEGDSLEYFLYKVKCFRNDLMHGNTTISSATFVGTVEEVRSLLTNTLKAAGTHYSINGSIVNDIINKMNHDINAIRDGQISPLDLQSYKDDLLFADLVNIMREKGQEELKELYTRNEVTSVNPASLILGCNWISEVEKVFTPLKLKDGGRGGQEKDIEYEDILLSKGGSLPQVVLVEGIAGAGKTTITRHLVSQWCCSNPTIKGIVAYDLLILMECRNHNLSSLPQLLDSLMPKTRQQFQDGDLLPALRRQTSLIFIDGLDEINDNSRKLMKDILDFNTNNEKAQVLVFSRPERVEDFYRMVEGKGYQVTHIRVGEIPHDKRATFVRKYHEDLKRQGQSGGDTKDLLQYLENTQRHLNHLWGLPLHLVMLTVLWASDHSRIKEIRSSTGLHLEFMTLSINKLCQRLVDKVPLSVDEVKRKIRIFLFALSKMALEALKEDIIVILTQDQISKLHQVCDRLQLPPDEVIGAFLVMKKSWTAKDTSTSVSFTHKSQQEFHGSLFMNHLILGGGKGDPDEEKQRKLREIGCTSAEIQSIILSSQDTELIFPLSEHHSALPESHIFSAQTAPPGATPEGPSLRSILEDVCKGNQDEATEMFKFTEPLYQLLCLMHMKGTIPYQEAQQMVSILNKAGPNEPHINHFEYWMKLLTEVNQNTVAKAIVEIFHDQYATGDSDGAIYEKFNDNSGDMDDDGSVHNDHDIHNDVLDCDVHIEDTWTEGAICLLSEFLPRRVNINKSSSEGLEDLTKILVTPKCHVKISVNDATVNIYVNIPDTFLPSKVVSMEIHDTTKPEWKEFMELLERQKIKVGELKINPESSASDDFCHLVHQVVLRCRVERYFGRVKLLGTAQIYPTLRRVYLSLEDDSDITMGSAMPNLESISLLVKKGISTSLLTPLLRDINELWINSLTDNCSDIEWAADVASALQPSASDNGIAWMVCPRSSFTKEGFLSFARRLKDVGVDVRDALAVKSPFLKGLQKEEKETLKQEIKDITGCQEVYIY